MIEIDLMKLFQHEASMMLPMARLFRRNIINTKTAAGWHAKSGVRGQCDLYAYVRGGKVIEIETKTRRGRLSQEQQNWKDFCQAWSIQWIQLKESKWETPEETVARWVRELRFAIGPAF